MASLENRALSDAVAARDVAERFALLQNEASLVISLPNTGFLAEGDAGASLWQSTPFRSTDLRSHPHITAMNLELDDEQAAALIKSFTIHPECQISVSPRIRMLRQIPRAKLRPEPVREPLPRPDIMHRRELPEPGGGEVR